MTRYALPLLALLGVALLPAPADPPPPPQAITFPPEKGDVLLLPAGAIDGDTYDAYVLVKVRCRLYGVNSPELHSADPKVKEKAVAAKANLDKLLPRVPSRAVFHGKEKFGRYLSDQRNERDEPLSKLQIDGGFGLPYDGHGPRP
jgi:endonuclease YncB( thermonuclease family)